MHERISLNEKDAYGHYLMEYYKTGQVGPEIVERSDGTISGGESIDSGFGAKLYFSEYSEWPANEKKALQFVRGKVLDVGCGAGRHLLYFQEQGIDIVGIDVSLLALKVCQERGAKSVILRSIGEVNKFNKEEFGTILMMDNNFGLFGSFDNARKLLNDMYEITTDNGLIIADSTDPDVLDDAQSMIYKEDNLKSGRMRGQLRMRVLYKEMKSSWFDYLLVSKDELLNILKGTGWGMKEILDGENGAYIAVLAKN